ncbi:hypothetical protein F4778DRAFT_741876 [Xylariomycetidae sp. FL2044]|nr:hypothetical protein F4778DRAFT_741876 [Xylariomycetidae sp. FL2044]
MKSILYTLTAATAIPAVWAATSTTKKASTTTTTAVATHTVEVGKNHDFNPDNITANVGDTIHFIFWPTNHSVVRADYNTPCIPYNYSEPGDNDHMFFSGPQLSQITETRPTWDLEVWTKEPIFFYCSAPDSCIKEKMVGAINPNTTMTLQTQIDAVSKSAFQLSPGEPFPDEGTPTDSGASPTNTGSSDTGIDSGSGGGSSLSPGAIAGIAIGGVVALALVAALIYFCGRRGGIEKGYRKSRIAEHPPVPHVVETQYAAGQYDGPAKSPPPPNSPYGAMSQTDTYRSSSPAQWSNHPGSPHHSIIGHPSPGQPPYGFTNQGMAPSELSSTK